MNLPDKLPIARIEDYHTHYLGQTKDGRLFWGYETFVFTKPYAEIQANDWGKFQKGYAVLHIFDQGSNYIETKHWSSSDSFNPVLTSAALKGLVAELGEVEYKDIEVKLFQTTIDEVVFGLMPNEESKTIELQPSSTIAFHEPWDGEYYT